MELSEYQTRALATDQRPGEDTTAVLFTIVGLESEVGSLTRHVKKWLRDGDAYELFASEMADEIGDILWYCANVASKLGLSMDEIASANLQKVAGRWPTQTSQPPLLDEAYPVEEQLPRRLEVRFEETLADDGKVEVRAFEGDRQLGDRLTDNSYANDGYRYHDAFHFTYAALLGWSPVVRRFLNRRRDSVPRVREVEDAGRAMVIEEAIAAFAFDYAADVGYLEDVEHVDFSLLTTIRRLTAGLEVRDRTASQWERAILRSFEIWRALRDGRGGVLTLDLHSGTIEYSSP